jgi:hypothetical protein
VSYVVTPFEVASRGLSEPVRVRFVHLFPAIATRHSDTIDAIFLVDGQSVTVAIWCAALNELREGEGKVISDQQLAEIAALHLRRTLQEGGDPTQAELFLGKAPLRGLATELGFL